MPLPKSCFVSKGLLGCNDLHSSADLKVRAARFLLDQVKSFTGEEFSDQYLWLERNTQQPIHYNETVNSITMGNFSLPLGKYEQSFIFVLSGN